MPGLCIPLAVVLADSEPPHLFLTSVRGIQNVHISIAYPYVYFSRAAAIARACGARFREPVCDTSHSSPGAAQPREPAAREGQDAENHTPQRRCRNIKNEIRGPGSHAVVQFKKRGYSFSYLVSVASRDL